MSEKTDFFKKTVPQALSRLHPDSQPKWGLLNAQAMIEHVIGSWRISNGKAEAQQVVTDEQLPKYREFLFSDQPFVPNTKNPIMPENEPPALRKPDLDSAKKQLEQEIADFFTYHQQNPGSKPVHPVFGPLDQEGWLTFQEKHMRHHFKQFDLLEE